MVKKPKDHNEPLTREEVKKHLELLVREIQITPKLKGKRKRCGKDSVPPTSPDSIAELLDYLRVCIKYNGYDLECTRREVNYLSKLLKDNNIEF